MKRVTVLTGSRADYDLLKNLIKILNKSKKIKLEILITGQHLSSNYGSTGNHIKKEFGKICKFIDIKVNKPDVKSILNSVSLGVNKIGNYLQTNRPDALVLLGDRYEILTAAIASIFNNIKIFHIHGGEITMGSIDDTIRHSVTKFSNFHLVSTESYRKRVIQLGENPKNVFNVGSLGAENVKKIKLVKKDDLEKKFKIKFKRNSFLITVNSFIEEDVSVESYMKNIFDAFKKIKNTTFIFTLPNSDIKSYIIKDKIVKFCKKNNDSFYFTSLGSKYYLSFMNVCDLVIGNSSSGILEAPSLKKPTINIGNRQKGRIQAYSIINSKCSSQEIYKSILKCLSPKFVKNIKKVKNPYYKKYTAQNIFKILNKKIYNFETETKTFYDLY